MKDQLLAKRSSCENWSISLLTTLLEARQANTFYSLNLDKRQLEEMISSLCKLNNYYFLWGTLSPNKH